jgi:sulfur-carrier protein
VGDGVRVTVVLPQALRPYAGGRAEVALDDAGATAGDVLRALARRHPGVTDRVLDERGEVRQHVNVFVDGESIRFLDGLLTPVREGSAVDVVPAVSGG